MRPITRALLITGLFLSLLILVSLALQNLRRHMGWQENGFEVWIFGTASFLGWKTQRGIWHFGLACAACHFMAYLAFRAHREDLRQVFERLGTLVILAYILDSNGKWRRRLWGKLKSAGLTVVNATSFKRQTKEAFG